MTRRLLCPTVTTKIPEFRGLDLSRVDKLVGMFAPSHLAPAGKREISLPEMTQAALKILSLQFDKNGSVFTKGLPTCKYGQLTNTLTAAAQKACGKALIGTGKVEAELQFPGAAKQPAKGTLLIFNGAPQGGKPVFLQHAYINSPVSTTVVTKAVIGKAHGKYGTSTTIDTPPLAGGYASLTSFTAKIAKSWTYKGQRVSLLQAKCPTGHLFAHGDFTFVNGDSLHGDVVKSCTPKG